MEILNSAADKRTVLVVLDRGEAADGFCEKLAQNFDVIRTASTHEAFAIMDERFNDLSATIIDAEKAVEDECAFLVAVRSERCFDTIPIVVVASDSSSEASLRSIDAGAVDVVEISCNAAVLVNRIGNAVQLMRSATFYEIESMLHCLPSMIFLKDAHGRYVFSTQYWHHLDMGGDPKWTIRGKTDVDIRKDKENAIMAMEADKEIIRSGKGTSYVIEINADGVTDFIQLIKEPVFDDAGNVTGIIALGNDVTEFELMKRKLERYARVDELTGLGNRRAFNEFLETIPNQSAFPIAVISADCDNLKKVNDVLGHLVGDEYLHMASVVLRAGVPDGALAFRTGGDEFVAFALNTDEQQAREIVESMRKKAKHFWLSDGDAVVSYGISIIEGPDSDVQAALDLADKRMYADKAAHKGSIPLK